MDLPHETRTSCQPPSQIPAILAERKGHYQDLIHFVLQETSKIKSITPQNWDCSSLIRRDPWVIVLPARWVSKGRKDAPTCDACLCGGWIWPHWGTQTLLSAHVTINSSPCLRDHGISQHEGRNTLDSLTREVIYTSVRPLIFGQ